MRKVPMHFKVIAAESKSMTNSVITIVIAFGQSTVPQTSTRETGKKKTE
jgi:hypothetical protein